MDKIAMYKEEIIKEAMARAWKTNIGELSNEAIKKLKSTGILDHAKELAGLNKGTANIVKKHNGEIGHFSSSEFANRFGNELNHNKALQEQLRISGLNKGDFIDAIKEGHKANDGFMTITGSKERVVSKGTVQKGGLIDELMGGQNRRKIHKKYVEALMNRHEADELRFAQNSLKGRKNNVIINGDKVAAGSFGSHISPKVLGAESANVAVAPPSVKKKMMNLRENSGESDSLSGLDYGRSGKYDKQTNAELQRLVVSVNKPQYKEMFGAE